MKETMGEILEATNFNSREVDIKLSSIEGKLDKDSGSSEFIKSKLGDIKELLDQPAKVQGVYIIPQILISFHDNFTLKLGKFNIFRVGAIITKLFNCRFVSLAFIRLISVF